MYDNNEIQSRNITQYRKYKQESTINCVSIDIDNDEDERFLLSDTGIDAQDNTNNINTKKEIKDDLSNSSSISSTKTTTTPIHNRCCSNDIQNISTDNNKTIPLIIVTHDEVDTIRCASTNLVHNQSETTKSNHCFQADTPSNMDNMNIKYHFTSSSCPNSPELSKKKIPKLENTASLSPPNPSPSSTLHPTGSGKRRGASHRASYKRAHTGRLSIDHTPNELFIELQELRLDESHQHYWHKCARWIRYEEDFDSEMQHWQAPKVGCLSFHSLNDLRRGLQHGIVLLDLDEQTLDGIYEAIINDCIANGHLNKDIKDECFRLLTSHHRQPEPRCSRRRSSIIDFPQITRRRSSLALKKNEQISCNNQRRLSLLELKPNGDVNRNLKDLIVKYNEGKDSTTTNIHPNERKNQPIITKNGSNDSVNQLQLIMTSPRHSQILGKKSRESAPYKSDLIRRIPEKAECAEVLVGSMRNLTRSVMAFVRLSQGVLIDNMTEVQLPVKFIFLLIGPRTEELIETGRSFSTLFSTPGFRRVAYQAMDRRDLLGGINDFMSDAIVLPPGDFDKEFLMPIVETARIKYNNAKRRSGRMKTMKEEVTEDNQQQQQQQTQTQINRIISTQISPVSHDKQEEDPFLRSGFIFGGVYREMHRRYSYFKSDFVDAVSLHCFISLIFMFIACLAPALTFGGIIADKTNNTLGVNEMLIASSINGFLFGLVSGQPLLILGPTGPFLVFEEMVYDLCQSLNTDYWTVRCCVSLWTTFFIIMLVAFEGSFMIRHLTRFTEEIFALIIALVYLFEPFKKLYKIFLSNPIQSKYNYDYPLTCSCNTSFYSNFTNSSIYNRAFLSTTKFSCSNCVPSKDSSFFLNNNSSSTLIDNDGLPNKALLSFIILLGTCFIAVALKRFRRSKFFGRTTRRTLSDFGMSIALICMVLVDMFVTKCADGHSLTQKITVPDSIRPSDRDRADSWYISPLRRKQPYWVYFASAFPAILISVVLFFEVELTSIMIQSKLKSVDSTKIIKGTGYHLDILIAGILISVNGLFGLPWICAAPVRSIAHVASLSKYSNTHAPGEKARLIDIKDQRLTNMGVHLFIGCTIFAAPIIRKIPVAALFGIFLYFGIVSISGTQFFTRMKMTFIPTKHHPNYGYLRRVRQMKRNIYTLIQVIAASLLIAIKVTDFACLFPFILVLLVPFRKWCLPLIFTERELSELDGDEEQNSIFDDEIDFYGQVHLPI